MGTFGERSRHPHRSRTTALRVRDLMTSDVVTVGEGATVEEILECLLANDVAGVPVVDDKGSPVGIVTEEDLLGRVAGIPPRPRRLLEALSDVVQGRTGTWERKIEGVTAVDIMSTPLQTASPEEAVKYPARRMARLGIKRLPVVVEGRLVGIVARHDLLNALARPDDEDT